MFFFPFAMSSQILIHPFFPFLSSPLWKHSSLRSSFIKRPSQTQPNPKSPEGPMQNPLLFPLVSWVLSFDGFYCSFFSSLFCVTLAAEKLEHFFPPFLCCFREAFALETERSRQKDKNGQQSTVQALYFPSSIMVELWPMPGGSVLIF